MRLTAYFKVRNVYSFSDNRNSSSIYHSQVAHLQPSQLLCLKPSPLIFGPYSSAGAHCHIAMSAALDLLLMATSWCHVLLAPYTKVEESFNLHATHDVLMYGVQPDALQNVRTIVFVKRTARN